MKVAAEQLDFFHLESVVWIGAARIDVPRYDFEFERFFACRRPYQRPDRIEAVGRCGVIENYSDLYQELEAGGVLLIHTPDEYQLASELPNWYPILAGLTPRSESYREPPAAAALESSFSYPFFVRGSRQTSGHQTALSIIYNRADYERVARHFRRSPAQRRQQFICREFINLRRVAPSKETEKLLPAFEFRTFWWRGHYAGGGPYWAGAAQYAWTRAEEAGALHVAGEGARRLNLPFVVIDVGQSESGEWLIIECNDAQESSYAGVAPVALWNRIVELESQELTAKA